MPPLFVSTRRYDIGSIRGYREIQSAFLCLHAALSDAGYAVNACSDSSAPIVLNWSGKSDFGIGPDRTVYLEHGWLPRWAFQISPFGTNARSHVASEWEPGTPGSTVRTRLCRHLSKIRSVFNAQVDSKRVSELKERFEKPFVLFPLQLASDYNLKFSDSPFQHLYSLAPEGGSRFSQSCIDRLEQADFPFPIVFKQHPADPSQLDGMLRFQNSESRWLSKEERISTHEIFATGLCRLVVSVNSNTVHEAAVWGIPSICLGRLLWRRDLEQKPFVTDLSSWEDALSQPALEQPLLLSYLDHLLRHQWTLNDLHNPLIVRELIERRGHCEPYALRQQLGLDLM
jgi:hypothetical protein